jgi:mitochondrial translocator assembly and maintenance protein 41
MTSWKTRNDDDSSVHLPLEDDDEDGQLTSSEDLLHVFHSTFPHQQQQDEIVYAFGYGSGVFAQTDTPKKKPGFHSSEVMSDYHYHDADDPLEQSSSSKTATTTAETKNEETKEKNMLDMIIIVEDAFRFHSINMQVNPHHYASPFFFSFFRDAARAATWWQKHQVPPSLSWLATNPKLFFNFVQDPPYLLLKYGVMERQDLLSDLVNWDSLYVAGRMQKPTATIVPQKQQEDSMTRILEQGQNRHNLPAALATALLLLSSSTAQQQQQNNCCESTSVASASSLPLSVLYSQISALSYTGDFRMQIGAEDPAKIDKLVHSPGQLGRFHQLYHNAAIQPLIDRGVVSLEVSSSKSCKPTTTTTSLVANAATTRIAWNPHDPATISHLRQCLPPRLQRHLLWMRNNNDNPTNNNNNKETTADDYALVIQRELHSIVAPAARYQSFKGLWTAGLTKSTSYALAKLSKGLLRRR